MKTKLILPLVALLFLVGCDGGGASSRVAKITGNALNSCNFGEEYSGNFEIGSSHNFVGTLYKESFTAFWVNDKPMVWDEKSRRSMVIKLKSPLPELKSDKSSSIATKITLSAIVTEVTQSDIVPGENDSDKEYDPNTGTIYVDASGISSEECQ